ncbi:MAG TPA: strawberry notch family protein, partial [Nitrosomonas sp.]|nr:strawberry notch family protein [Nitrosomonas sp.]
MSAVEPPAPSYSPILPKGLIDIGLLSIAQLEAVVYAGQAHSELLPNGSRKGFFIGDGTGVGKGREISGIILDNMMQGRSKAVWVSFNEGLIEDARRDFAGVGGNPNKIFFQGKTKAGNEISQEDGILFTTYSTLRGGEKKQANDLGQQGGKTRAQQIIDWLGKDFDGVIAFDEAHSMGNAIAVKGKRGVKKPSQQAIAGINLQRELPNARITYVSATGATEISNLSYADRLGLWGEGTPFADTNSFINGVSKGGIASMELISRDMKAMGMYLARSLSYDGVSYERLEHTLSDLQEDIYNELAGAWQVVLNNVEQALEITQAGKNGNGKSAAMSQFWGAHQRFFNQIITAMQTPRVIDDIRAQLDVGHVAVIQLVNTNEAAQERIIADATANDAALEDLDFTPRQMLMDYVRNGFPVAAYEESKDENGNTVYLPVKDSEGNPVFDREAIALRDALLETLQQIRVPENPLDSIINAFGSDRVAEVTGRSRRFVQTRDEEGNLKVVEEKRGKNSSRSDAEAFQANKKDILIFSGAGGTGYSFHADNTAENQRKRIHYILQPGWRADSAVQGFGRTHRTNQAQEPHYVLPTTNLKAQKRFVSSIARRLDQLGALTRGQREATSQGMFTASDNLESEYAATALKNFFGDLYRGKTDLSFHDVTKQMGLNLLDENASLSESKIPAIPQFLNRLLSLKTDMQNAVFGEFERRLVEAVEYAKQRGLYDVGLQTMTALSIQKTRDDVVYEDKNTGALTRYVELSVTNEIKYNAWEDAKKLSVFRRDADDLSGWFVSEFGKNKGEVIFLSDIGERINSEGVSVRRGVLHTIRKQGHRYIDNADVMHRGYDYRTVVANGVGSFQKVTLTRSIDEAEAEKLWKEQVANAPKTETKIERMIVGVILPIWDRVEGSETIKRLQTDDGEQLLGRMLGQKAAQQTLKNLGLNSGLANMSPSDFFEAVKKGSKAILSNGWEISTAKVNHEDRIEIKGRGYLTDAEKRVLKEQGAFSERINWADRVFIPTGVNGLSVFERITASKPVVDLIARNVNMDVNGNEEEQDYGIPQQVVSDSVITGPIPEPAMSESIDNVSNNSQSISENLHHNRNDHQEVVPMDQKKRPFHEIVAENLIRQLEAGTAPWQRPWDAGESGSFLPYNPTTGNRYKGINALHLMSQDRDDQRWMTYKQASEAGGQVRKGEKGTGIQYWKFTEEHTQKDDNGNPVLDGDGNLVKVVVRLERPRVFFATVFNGEQIDGLLPIEKKELTWAPVERA